jgi:hypothetical protein
MFAQPLKTKNISLKRIIKDPQISTEISKLSIKNSDV